MKKLLAILLTIVPGFLMAQNVGIGTTTPTAKLEIKKPVKSIVKISSDGYTDTTQLILSNRNALNQGTDFLFTSSQEQGLFFSSASDLPSNTNDSLFSITMNGATGIGCKFPTQKLHVHNAVATTTLINITNSTTGVGPNKGLIAGMAGSNALILNREAGNIQLGTSNLVRATLDVDGNLGIATSSPDEKLEVVGNIKLSGEINRASTTTTNLLPIAWGNISAAGTIYISSSSGNFTVSHPFTGFYSIAITGENSQFQSYSAIATPVGSSTPVVLSTGSGSNELQINSWNLAGMATDTQFNFVVYKK